MLVIKNLRDGRYQAIDAEYGIDVVLAEVDENGFTEIPRPNSSNRRWIHIHKLEKIVDSVELPYRESRTLGPQSGKKSWLEYLTEDELIGYNELKFKGEARKAEDKPRPKTALEKAKERYEKALKDYEKLTSKEQK